MGKASGVARRRKKIANHRYSTSKKLKRLRRSQLKKGGGINCDPIRESWDGKKSLRKNLTSMGLSHDPNALFKKEQRLAEQKELIGERNVQTNTEKLRQKLLNNKKKKQNVKTRNQNKLINDTDDRSIVQDATTVVDKLEMQASVPRVKAFRFGPDKVKFCAYMIEKYGDDYESMERDKMNYYQESAGQIRSKIRRFLSIPEHRRVYEKAKELVEESLNS
ncbi:hypothetical protein RDWZM_002470 [Blomia tropicalis]|uniref:Nucleolar protein 16 n=1 Tax=Blomia tropicalis TaxID=40697 RepID=A0A9Q0MHY5_BLOTA|nr:Nucleolar protein 16 [Blomia tropicalis]KAJ6223925.1 hypothetical protein RDWZM_002470 [Blomia tropicalis]